MRNLKRALSLTLASVMLLGMMVVGSSAAAGYDDVKETDNVEAIEVLQAVEVMVGDERGFGPDRPVSRAEMAVVMGKLLNLDYNYYASTCPFTDVSGNYDWARGWVGACAANGIVSGRGNGVYDPAATVTAVEAASMMMRALGYFKYTEDYAAGFVTATVKQGSDIGIFNGVGTDGTTPMTRNQVAQMALNALRSEVVTFTGTPGINVNGVSVSYRAEYTPRTSTEAKYNAIEGRTSDVATEANHKGQYYIQLGEQLYDGKLKLNNKAVDVFGRPSRYWEYDSKEIGTYIKKELIREEYTVKVTGKTLYELLGKTILDDYDLDVYIDGVDNPDANKNVFDRNSLVRTNDKAVGDTGKGVLTQVFLDPDRGDNGLITIAIINTYLAKADEDYDDRTEDVDVTVYGIDEIPGFKNEFYKTANIDTDDGRNQHSEQKYGFKLEVEDFPEAVDVKDGDFFLVNVAEGEIQTLGKPEVLSKSQISTFKQGSYVITGGTQYDFADSAEYDWETLYMYTEKGSGLINLKDITYNVYLDQYGYAIGVEEVDREDNYLFITGVDTNTNNRYAVQADATAIFLDGTMASIKIDMKAVRDLRNDKIDKGATEAALTNGEKGGSLVNRWFTYSVDANDVYDVVLVGDYTRIDDKSINARAAQWCVTMEKDHDDAKNGVNEIGPKSIALRGTDKPDSTWYSVYGDDQSVYITAELDTIQDAYGEKHDVNVISGVDNVVVGVDNASIDIWTIATAASQGQGVSVNDTAYGAYTLFDKDGDIIAAVVVGEDSGATTNLVYTHEKKLESETDNNVGSSRANVKGDYTWTRKVVSGSTGKEILLTEVGSGLSKLKNMEPNTWYVVKYNAKGEVKNVYPAWDTYSYSSGKIATSYKGLIDAPARNADGTVIDSGANEVTRLEDRYVNDIEELNRATNENTTVLYEVGQYNTGDINGDTTTWDGLAVGDQIYWYGAKPSVDNHTFYMNTATSVSKHQGFRVSDDVQTVFIQTNNNDTTTTFESGYSRLEKVVDRLHDHAETNRSKWTNPDTYHYEISAVMENSKAIVVVIRDLNDAGADIRPIDRAQELRLYGTLFTSPNGTVTGNSDTVVTVDDKVVEPSGIETDMGGSYTIYHIQPDKTVSITDWDIQETTFKSITNMTWAANDYREIKNQRTITFTMPNRTAIVVGSETTANTGDVKIKIDNKDLSNLNAKFLSGGKTVDSLEDKTVGQTVDVVIGTDLKAFTGIEANATYTVKLGTPGEKYTGIANAAGNRIVVNGYKLQAFDIWSGYVTVNSIEKDGSGNGDTPIDATGLTVNVTGLEAGDALPTVTASGTGFTAEIVWKDAQGNVITGTFPEADTEATYTYEIVVKLDEGYKLPDGFVATGSATVAPTGEKTEIGPVNVVVGAIPAIGEKLPAVADVTVTGAKATSVWSAETVAESNVLTITVTLEDGYKLPANFAPTVNGKSEDVDAGTESNTWTYTVAGTDNKLPTVTGTVSDTLVQNLTIPDGGAMVEITVPAAENPDSNTWLLVRPIGGAYKAGRIVDGKVTFYYETAGSVTFETMPITPNGYTSDESGIVWWDRTDPSNPIRREFELLPTTATAPAFLARAVTGGFEVDADTVGSVKKLTIGESTFYGVTLEDDISTYTSFPLSTTELQDAFWDAVDNLPVDENGMQVIPDPVPNATTTTNVPTISRRDKTIDVGCGAPLVVGALLPTELTVDNTLTFTVTWYYDGEPMDIVEGEPLYAEGEDLSLYTAEVAVKKAEDATVSLPAGEYTITKDGEAVEGGKLNADAINEGVVITTENTAEEAVFEADDRCQAVIAANGTITLNVYADFEPTDNQIRAAIAKAVDDNLTSKDIIIDGTAVTIEGETGFTLAEEAGELFKVQIGTDDSTDKIVKYATNANEITGLPATILALLPADKLIGGNADAITMTGRDVTKDQALSEDVKWMPALKLWDGSTDGQTIPGGYTAYYADGKSSVWTGINTTNHKSIQVGVDMLFVKEGLTEGQEAGVKVAGVDFKATVNDKGTLNVKVTGITKYDGENEAITLADIPAEEVVSTEAYTVKVNNNVVTNTAEDSDGKWKVNDRVVMTEGVAESALIVGNYYEAESENCAIATFVPASGKKEFVLTPAIAALADENGVIELNGAYQVTDVEATDFTIADAAETNTITIADGSYVIAGRKLTVTASAVGKILAAKEGSSYTLGEPDEAIVLTKDTADTAKASWTIELTGDIAADEFEAAMTLEKPTATSWKTGADDAESKEVAAASDGAATAAPDSWTIVITGADGDFSADMEAAVKESARWNRLGFNGDIIKLTVKAVTYADNDSGADTLTITFENATEAALTMKTAKDAAEGSPAVLADTGVFQVEVGGATLQYTVTVEAGTDA